MILEAENQISKTDLQKLETERQIQKEGYVRMIRNKKEQNHGTHIGG